MFILEEVNGFEEELFYGKTLMTRDMNHPLVRLVFYDDPTEQFPAVRFLK